MSLVVIKVAVAFGEGTVVRLRGTGLGAQLDRMRRCAHIGSCRCGGIRRLRLDWLPRNIAAAK